MSEKPLRELIELVGKVAIVTGGARGIGFAISSRLAEAGASVLLADIDGGEAETASQALLARGYSTCPFGCDVSCEEDVQRMVQTCVGQFGGVDILVNNAGVYPRKSLGTMSGEDFDEVIAVNLRGTFLCSRYAGVEMMRQRRGGCIINIASIEALHPSASGMSAYDASKGGVWALTKSLARELGPYGIRVNAIAPGSVITRWVSAHLGNSASAEQEAAQRRELKSFMARIVLGRMGDADDIARVALFLASELSDYVTGEMIVVDGGYLVG
jgi:NAD(P)-dependent dehydrogenase (short-subunit alcohol dehydrogenase family)